MVDFPGKDKYDLEDFRKLVEILRHEGGCPWDREQTHQSLRRNTLEEAYEVCGAIDEGDPAHLREELGDMLLHVMFHSSIEADAERFDLDDVADAACKKLIFRHPHVFAGAQADSAAAALDGWEAIKEKERAQRTLSEVKAGVTGALPSLWRAEKIQKKTAKAGFDWQNALSALDKLEEEVRELRAALEAGKDLDAPHGVREELGDTLFMAAKIGQMTGVDPEDALHRACDKFDARFRHVEQAADKPLSDYDEAGLIALWKDAKAHEQS